MGSRKLILDYIYEHERDRRDEVFLTQPIGGGQVKDYTWGEAMDESRRMAAHLKSLGLPPQPKIAILSKNCAHFFMAELAIWMAGGTTVAIFPTESANTISYVLEHSDASLLFVGKLDTWEHQKTGVPPGMRCIAFPLAPPTDYDTWDAVVERTRPIEGNPSRQPLDLSMLIYTSGSTGQPKGAMHGFEGITRVAEGIVAESKADIGEDFTNRMLSYLPLAHCFERAWVECAAFVSGNTHIFFAESLDTFVQDLKRARPTTFVSVPRLWLKFQQGVFSKMPPHKLERMLRIPLFGKVVAKKVLEGLGLDHVKRAGSGSAPIPADLIEWYRRLGLNLIEGYAMTEDFAYSHGARKGFSEAGYVGVPLEGVKAKLGPDGEILVKSPGRMLGYYKQPELTAQSFTDDGYFRTGDLGEYNAQGLLKITGRAKEQFKTSKGKYVAPAPIENRLNSHPMVELSIVMGAGQPDAYAMVVLAEHLRPKQSDPAVRQEVQSALASLLQQVNTQGSHYENLRMIVVAKEPWSIENGCLTPTMKIKRSRIENAVSAQMDAWYSSKEPVVWAQ